MSDRDDRATQDIAVPGESREVVIEALSSDGRGVARDDGLVWLVRGGLPGDRVRARVSRARRRFVEGEVDALLAPAPERREPPCPAWSRCGGCPWMPLPEGEQARWKGKVVADALRRIGGIEAEVDPVVASPRALGYRNKVEFTYSREQGSPVLGLFGPGRPPRLSRIEACMLQGTAANELLRSLHDLLPEGPWQKARVAIRSSRVHDELLVALRTEPRATPEARALARELRRRHPRLAGVVEWRSAPGRRGDATYSKLSGRTWLPEEIGGTRFRLPATAFFQVNPEAAEKLLDIALEEAGALFGLNVLDLYSGVGVQALTAARKGATVQACEADASAIECGLEAAEREGIDKVRFQQAEVGRTMRGPGDPVDVVLANPPRDGFGKGVAEGIARRKAKRVVIVSCDPATLARDLKALVAEGYRLDRVRPVDLFPQTPHVETVASLSR
ncbi:hypothetical protein ABI59_05030 [Acidobacteria bacterium Mor1]|nr:hypothetical protein ABI59_05030 [Acidobacteria bacterium Mor1]